VDKDLLAGLDDSEDLVLEVDRAKDRDVDRAEDRDVDQEQDQELDQGQEVVQRRRNDKLRVYEKEGRVQELLELVEVEEQALVHEAYDVLKALCAQPH